MQHEPDPHSKFTLALLAGGEGSRMGMPKGELVVSGEPILRYLKRRFQWPGPTLLVTAPGREHPTGWELFEREAVDPVGGFGPLRGILTALENAVTERVMVMPVDMPGLAAEQLRWLASAFDILHARRPDLCGLMTCRAIGDDASDPMVRVERRVEPLPAAFHRNAAAPIRVRLEAGHGSVHALAAVPGFLVMDSPRGWGEGTWVNLNRPEDLRQYLQSGREMGAESRSEK